MAGGVITESLVMAFRDSTQYLAFVGALSVTYLALKGVSSFWSFAKVYFLAPLLGLGVDLKSLGSWAVVTGSTDGIGKAYANELARRGINIVLISRSIDKLKAVAEEIESTHKVKTKVIAIDFSGGIEIYDQIASQLNGLEIGTLVNNVGASYDFPKFFTEMEGTKDLQHIINININSVTFMTKIVLPKMVERRKGAIINISSLSGGIPTPLLTVYSATKAYVDFFSRGLEYEYKAKGIIVQSVLPGFVATKMSKIRRATLIAPSPDSFVSSALATVGVAKRTAGCFVHALQDHFTTAVIPEWVYNYGTIRVMMGARARGMKKQKSQ